jgi:membrane-associated phospholipid phosphatase
VADRRKRKRAGRVRWPLLAGVAAAVVVGRKRRDLGLPPRVVLPLVAATPIATATALPHGRLRAAAAWAVQMWAYKVAFELPYDDPERARERLHIDYPIRADSVLGAGEPPTARLQRRLRRPPSLSWLDRAAALFYFTWEAEPHAALLWILCREPERFPAAAARLGAAFDLTLVGYYACPTAPPWWASEYEGRMDRVVRRVVAEVAKELRGKPRPGLDHNAGANPWASMPSDHFGSAAMTAMLLSEISPVAGVLGWAYALTLGAVLVYTGEHYVTDLGAGLLLALGVRACAPLLTAPAGRVGAALSRLAPGFAS